MTIFPFGEEHKVRSITSSYSFVILFSLLLEVRLYSICTKDNGVVVLFKKVVYKTTGKQTQIIFLL